MQHIHLLGICGTGMGALAQLLKAQGHHISGSDQNIYPPMSLELEKLKIPLFQGYSASNLHKKPDLAIIGNVIRKDNPEAQAVIEQNIPYLSMPQAIAKFFLTGKKSLVVAGTHGKTTTTTLLAWLLEESQTQPGFLVGGVGKNLNCNARIGSGPYFAIEGDEYDTAFFDKGPKFLHYQPHAVILTSVEFDHADIYRDLEHVMSSFEKLIALIPNYGFLIACADDENVQKLAKNAKCQVVWYSIKQKNADFFAQITQIDEDYTNFQLHFAGKSVPYQSTLCGEHNISNIAGVLALLYSLQVPEKYFAQALQNFAGVKRRQELLGKARDVIILDDFAHHPTAVEKTLAAIRGRYPKRKLWAVFEPRSNSTRRNHFQAAYAQAFANADQVFLGPVHRVEDIPADERFDAQKLVADLKAQNIPAQAFTDYESMPIWLAKHAPKSSVVLFMSNGSFQGVPHKTLETLKTLSD